jgi:hypothetical protein
MASFFNRRFFVICLLILVVGIFIVRFYNITNKLYLFTYAEVEYDWGFIGAKMNETYTSTENESIASSPYVLGIVFRVKSKVNGSVTMKSIKLTNADETKIFYENNELQTEGFSSEIFEGTYDADFFIRDLKPDYERLKLYLKYTIETDQFVKEGETILYFDTVYKEYRSNKTWDRLMGV